jgi:hypothetical protein
VSTKPSSLIRCFLDYLYAGGCGIAAILMANIGHLTSFVASFRWAGVVLLWIAAIYFWQRGFRRAMRFQVERRFRYEAEHAPVSLGLNELGLNQVPAGIHEHEDEDES